MTANEKNKIFFLYLHLEETVTNTVFTLKQIYTDSKYIRIHIKTIKLKRDKYIYISNCLH